MYCIQSRPCTLVTTLVPVIETVVPLGTGMGERPILLSLASTRRGVTDTRLMTAEALCSLLVEGQKADILAHVHVALSIDLVETIHPTLCGLLSSLRLYTLLVCVGPKLRTALEFVCPIVPHLKRR
jgi:hypothetical protein